MINKFYIYREKIYTILLFVIFFSYLISFAVCSITTFAFLAFFFIDKRTAVIKKIKLAKGNILIYAYALFFLVQCFGLLYSTSLDFGLKRVSIMLPILFLPMVIFTENINLKLFNKLLDSFTYWIIGLFILFLIIHLYIDGRRLNNFVLYYLNDKLGISQFYISFIIIIPFLKLIKDIKIKKGMKMFLIVESLILLFFALLLGNVTVFAFLSLFFVFQIFVTFKNKNNWFKLGLVFIIFVLVSVGAFLTPKINEKLIVIVKTTDFDYEIIKTKHSVTFVNNTFEKRVLLNMCSINIIKNNFPFGVGTGDFMDELIKEYKRINFKSAIRQKYNNHNQYLSEFTKTGILGGVCFIFIICLLLKTINYNDFFYTYLVLLFVIGCFVESYLYRQHGVLIFSFFIPLFYAYERSNSLN